MAASLPPLVVARRADRLHLPPLRRTPPLLPAVAAGARTEILIRPTERKNGSEFRSRFSFATSGVLEPQVSRDLQDARVVCAGDLPERRADVLSVVVEILKFRMVEEIERINAKLERDAFPIEWRHFRQRQIQVGASWSTQHIARSRAIALDDVVVEGCLREELQAIGLRV